MQERFTKKAKTVIENAHEIAVKLEHSYIGTEHILVGLAMVEDSVAGIVLNSYNVTSEKLIDLIEQYIDPMRPIGLAEPDGFTPKAEALLVAAGAEARRYKSKLVGTEHILIAILKGNECAAPRLLNTLGINAQKMYVDLMVAMGQDPNKVKEELQNGKMSKNKGKSPTQALDQFSRDLTLLAKEGQLDPVIGREEEMLLETNRMLLAPEIVELYQQQLAEAEEMSQRRAAFEMLAKIKDISSDERWLELEPEIMEWLEKEKSEYRK